VIDEIQSRIRAHPHVAAFDGAQVVDGGREGITANILRLLWIHAEHAAGGGGNIERPAVGGERGQRIHHTGDADGLPDIVRAKPVNGPLGHQVQLATQGHESADPAAEVLSKNETVLLGVVDTWAPERAGPEPTLAVHADGFNDILEHALRVPVGDELATVEARNPAGATDPDIPLVVLVDRPHLRGGQPVFGAPVAKRQHLGGT